MNRRFLSIAAIMAIGLLTVVNSLVLARQNASAAHLSAPNVPQLIGYQGRLTDADGNPLTGTYNMQFCLYDMDVGGTPVDGWCEDQTVSVTDGVFSVLLGSVTPIPETVFDGTVCYLGVKVESDNEMTPRRQVVSVGYAYRAEESSTADYASSAGNADTADYASSAGNSDTVDDMHASEFASATELDTHKASTNAHHTRYADAEAVAAIKAADGAGSGLDADTVDGQDASAFAATEHGHTNIQGFFWNSADFTYVKAGVNCGNTPRTANQLCQEAGFSSAVYAKGYHHGECAGPSMLSCEGVECFPAATNCVGKSNHIGEIREGDGSTEFSVSGCGGWNPGWFIRLQCQP